MLRLGAASCINDSNDLESEIESFRLNPAKLLTASNTARNYVNKNRGASKEIVKYLFH